jgi:hypothetical protein
VGTITYLISFVSFNSLSFPSCDWRGKRVFVTRRELSCNLNSDRHLASRILCTFSHSLVLRISKRETPVIRHLAESDAYTYTPVRPTHPLHRAPCPRLVLMASMYFLPSWKGLALLGGQVLCIVPQPQPVGAPVQREAGSHS